MILTSSLAGLPILVHVGEWRPPPGQLGFDVETTAIRPLAQWATEFRVKTCQFATRDEAWVYVMSDPIQATVAREVLEDKRNSFVSHTSYDALSALLDLGIDIIDRTTDTHILASIRYQDPGNDRDLKSLCTKLVGPELQAGEDELHAAFLALWPAPRPQLNKASYLIGWDRIGDEPEPWSDEYRAAVEVYWRYAGLDAVAVLHVADKLAAAIKSPPELVALDQRMAARAVRLQVAGWLVDTEGIEWKSAEVETAHDRIRERVLDITDGVKVNSVLLARWLAGEGLTTERWAALGGGLTPNGVVSLGKDSLPAMMRIELTGRGREVMAARIAYMATDDLGKKLQTILRLTADDGRVHTPLKVLGAVRSARMSSTGVNTLALSPAVREFFMAEDGMVLVSADLANIEVRVAAALSQDPALLAAFQRGDDLHSLTAERLGVSRKVAKTLNLALQYGGGAPSVMKQLGVERSAAAALIKGVKALYPTLYRTVDEFSTFPAMRTTHGRWLKGVGRNNFNHCCQAVARDWLCEASEIFADVWGSDACWLFVHDEIIAQVDEDDGELCLGALIESLSGNLLGVPITATGAVLGSRWRKL